MLNKNIFNVSNPMFINEALWNKICEYKDNFNDVLIFLPSRRAIRSVERMIVDKIGHATILPNLVPLGTGVEDDEDNIPEDDVFTNMERVVMLSRLLSMDANVGNIANALPIAHDLVRMQDYLENEGIDITNINWSELVDDKYATHFQNKAQILDIIKHIPNEKPTTTQKRNHEIHAWTKSFDKYKLVVVCGSTASVPATADLMVEIAKRDNGIIILSGKISGRVEDFELSTNPYNAEYKFLKRIGIDVSDIETIQYDENKNIDTFNIAFGNTGQHTNIKLDNCKLVECERESDEAIAATIITQNAIKENKSVLIITPDSAANQRIQMEMQRNNIPADFSAGIPATMSKLGRAILNMFDCWIENDESEYDKKYSESDFNIFNMLVGIVDGGIYDFQPRFKIDDESYLPIWDAIKNMSDVLIKNDMHLSLRDMRAFISDTISGVSLRPNIVPDCKVCVLGTIESRMQTADVIILTGLNEGMFPATGYENAWLPRAVAEQIGLPSPNKKVSLMALDFMNLSCAKTVYWLRSKHSGGVVTNESRFLSRVRVCCGEINKDDEILKRVNEMDKVEFEPLDYSYPCPPADKSDIFVTDLELLIHNPYAYYASHILGLKPKDDYWVQPYAAQFGILVHASIQESPNLEVDDLIERMRTKSKEFLSEHSIIYYFWDKRFREIAEFVNKNAKHIANAKYEKDGSVMIMGRKVCARADVIWDDMVMDIKTGEAPKPSQLKDGTMPQLPLEGYMLQNNGFKEVKIPDVSMIPILQFLQLKNGRLELQTYSDEDAEQIIDATVNKTQEVLGQYNNCVEYEYRETNDGDYKYKKWDDLARIDD